MPPGRKEWFHDSSDDYVIGIPKFDGKKSDKTNDGDFWNDWSNPLHLSDYVPGTRIPKKEWKGKKFWKQKPIAKSSLSKMRFPTSEGKCPLCGNDLHLIPRFIPPFGTQSEFYGCNSFPYCNFTCSVKQYKCVVKEVPNGEPIEIINTMKASEARTLAENSNSLMNVVSFIRKTIDEHIKDVADMGELETTISLSENGKFPLKRISERVVELLKIDGYEASCKCSYDPREREYIATYYIKW